MALRLPEPMLARAGAIPRGRGWTFEPKLDGFRCLVCTHAGFRARSRRGWDMTPAAARVPPQPARRACSSTASSSRSTRAAGPTSTGSRRGCCTAAPAIAVTLFVFDVLAVEGLATTMQPYCGAAGAARGARRWRTSGCGWWRRSRTGRRCSRPCASAASRASWRSGCAIPYRPGERGWVKTKNRATARFAEEREGVGRRARPAARWISPR